MSWEATNWARQAVATGVLKCGEGFVLVLLADHAAASSASKFA